MKHASELRNAFEVHLGTIRDSEAWQGTLYQPMKYILSLGGKRIRPLLALLAYEAFGGEDYHKALNLASAVELFHNFSLMHDDIMDNAPMRRGQPTVHEKWDEDTAILSGDAMFALTFEMLIQDFPEKAAPLIKEFTRISVGVCEGQMEDMEMAHDFDSKVSRYVNMIRRKTAMLIGGSMSLGAIAAGAGAEDVQKAYRFGELAGIGFQFQDDLLDVYADKAKFGKQIAGDILEGKMTFLLLSAFQDADESQRQRLQKLITEENQAETRIQGVKAIYAELDIPGKTEKQINLYFEQAAALGRDLSTRFAFEPVTRFLGEILKREF